MRKIITIVFVVAGMLLLTQSGFANWSPKPIELGESYVYKVKWMGVPVARVKVEVIAEREFQGRPAYVVEVLAKTNKFTSVFYRVDDRFVSYIDKEKLVPLRLEVSRREGSYEKEAITIFDHAKGVAYFENFLDGSKKQYEISSESHDIISLFYFIRYNKIELDKQHRYELAFAEELFLVEGKPNKKKKIEFPDGKVKEVFYAKPVARKKKDGEIFRKGTGSCYFSNDTYQIPVFLTLKAPIFTKITAVLAETTIF